VQSEYARSTFAPESTDVSTPVTAMSTQPSSTETSAHDVTQSNVTATPGVAHDATTMPDIVQEGVTAGAKHILNERLLKRFGQKRLAVLGSIAFYLMLTLLVLAALSFAVSDNPNKSFFGFRWYWIQTGSMEPELSIGALAIVKVVEPEKVRVGDDVTFRMSEGSTDQFVTHRVVEVLSPTTASGEVSFITKGIANPSNDPLARPAEAVVGKVILGVPFLGSAMAILRANVIPIAIIIVSLLFIYYILGRKPVRYEERKVSVEQ
jgi:signal peptidase